MAEILAYYFLAFFIFLVSVIITRWVFSISKIVRTLEAQRDILAEMAKKSGVDDVLVNNIVKHSRK